MNRQEFYRQEYKKLKPEWINSMNIYKGLIQKELKKNKSILDIGCGHGNFLKDIYAITEETYGLDPDADALAKNTFIKNKTVGRAEKIPFPDNFFDIVVSVWVLEHINNPQQVFSEIYRVLKPGGKIISLTPNSWNYNVWIIRAIPNRFHEFFTRRLYERKENDTYPTRYKINAEGKMDKTLLPIGFRKSEIIFNGDPSYISFNKVLFKFACLLEKLLDVKALQKARVHLISVYEK